MINSSNYSITTEVVMGLITAKCALVSVQNYYLYLWVVYCRTTNDYIYVRIYLKRAYHVSHPE